MRYSPGTRFINGIGHVTRTADISTLHRASEAVTGIAIRGRPEFWIHSNPLPLSGHVLNASAPPPLLFSWPVGPTGCHAILDQIPFIFRFALRTVPRATHPVSHVSAHACCHSHRHGRDYYRPDRGFRHPGSCRRNRSSARPCRDCRPPCPNRLRHRGCHRRR